MTKQDGLRSEEDASVHYASHNLREMFSRENATRRREGGHTLRKYLTDAQDRKILNSFVKLRDKFVLTNNNDAVLAWVKQEVEAGRGEGIHPKLLEDAERIPLAVVEPAESATAQS